MRAVLSRLALAIGLLTLSAPLLAQPYPDKPIRLVIPTTPGGGTDAIGRVVGEVLAARFRVPVVPENRPGASAQKAADHVVKSPPDGYTIMIAQNAHVTNPAFFKKLPYDTLKDFTPIATVAMSPLVLVASGESKLTSWGELVAQARREPDSLSCATADSSSRLAVEQINEAAKMKLVALPYKGTGPAVNDVAGGHVNCTVTTIASILPFKGTGRAHVLAVLGNERSPFLPDVPTLAELGISGVEVKGWWGIFGPAHLPAATVEQLNEAIRTALAQPKVQAAIQTVSADPWIGTAQDLDQFVRREVPKIQRLAKQAGIEPE
jgi:tripartite-type tricarboxylate transporter receptor subunit TctC